MGFETPIEAFLTVIFYGSCGIFLLYLMVDLRERTFICLIALAIAIAAMAGGFAYLSGNCCAKEKVQKAAEESK